MTNPTGLIDFTELPSGVKGEGLEQLARQIGNRMNLSPVWSGRGADRGVDLIFTENLEGPLSRERIRWLVSCKDKATSGDSVHERDLPTPSIQDKLKQHGSNGFLLVTTTTASTNTKTLLDSLDKRNGGDIHTLVWDLAELTSFLLRPENHDILQQFLPQSYQRVKGLTSLEGALLAFRQEIPDEILDEIMRMVRPYSGLALKGEQVWPYDTSAAIIIDNIVKRLLIDQDEAGAAGATKGLGADAFAALVNIIYEHYEQECFKYLLQVATQEDASGTADIRFNAAQFLFDNYEMNSPERIRISLNLDSDALDKFYGQDVIDVIVHEIYHNTPEYELFQSLMNIYSGTVIDEVTVENILFSADKENDQIKFSGEISIGTTLIMDKESISEPSFPGDFSGYIDEYGIHLESAVINTSSYFGDDDDDDDLWRFDEEEPA